MAESDKNGLQAGAAWIDGRVMPIAAARLPINDWGIIHSDITYDVVPAWDGGFFRLDDYIGRFQNSVAALRLDVGMDSPAIAAALTEMVAASGLRNAYVAMVASRGVPLIPGTRDPRECGNHFYAWCVPYIRVMRADLPDAERSAWIAKSVRRIPETSVDPRVKNYHWGDFTAAMFEAKDMALVVRGIHSLGSTVQDRIPSFPGPHLGVTKSKANHRVRTEPQQRVTFTYTSSRSERIRTHVNERHNSVPPGLD